MHARDVTGDERFDQRRVLVRVRFVSMIILIMMAGGVLLVIVTGLRVGPVAMIKRSELRHTAAIAQESAMQAKHLRPKHRRKGDQGEAEAKRGTHGRRLWDRWLLVHSHLLAGDAELREGARELFPEVLKIGACKKVSLG